MISCSSIFADLKTKEATLFLITGKTREKSCKQVAVRPISDSDTSNMQIRTLTQGLGKYSVKRLLMNTQG